MRRYDYYIRDSISSTNSSIAIVIRLSLTSIIEITDDYHKMSSNKRTKRRTKM